MLVFSGRSRSDRQGHSGVSVDRRSDSHSTRHRDARDADMYHVGRRHSSRKVYVLREVPPTAGFKVALTIICSSCNL